MMVTICIIGACLTAAIVIIVMLLIAADEGDVGDERVRCCENGVWIKPIPGGKNPFDADPYDEEECEDYLKAREE